MEGFSYFCSTILLLIFYHLTNHKAYSLTPSTPSNPNIDYIQKSCNTTLYPQMCYAYLSPYATKIHRSPKLLAKTALAITLSSTRSASKDLKGLSQTLDLKGGEVMAMKDCMELVRDAVYELDRSVKQMAHPGSDFVFAMSNVETWVSSALTDANTCMDGFSEIKVSGEAKNMVGNIVSKVANLTSIALAFINNYASI